MGRWAWCVRGAGAARAGLGRLAGLAGCGGSGSGAPAAPVTVSVSPATASVSTGGTQAFTATVPNSTNGSVSWQVGGVSGGNATLGDDIGCGAVYRAGGSALPGTGDGDGELGRRPRASPPLRAVTVTAAGSASAHGDVRDVPR